MQFSVKIGQIYSTLVLPGKSWIRHWLFKNIKSNMKLGWNRHLVAGISYLVGFCNLNEKNTCDTVWSSTGLLFPVSVSWSPGQAFFVPFEVVFGGILCS